MKLAALLTEDAIKPGLESTEKYAVIEELVDFLIERGMIESANRGPALDALRAREESMSTGMEQGVALPHATVDFLEDAACVLGIHRKGVDFNSADGKSAHLIVLMLVPKDKFHEHVSALTGIARLMHADRLRERLKKANSPREAMNIIREEE
jgi:PTS system fructose-specific IIA component